MDQFILAAKHNAPGVWLRSSRRTGPRLIGISRYITLIGINAKIPRLIVRFKNRRPLRVRHRPPVSQGDGRLFCTTQLLIWQKRAVARIMDFFGFDRSCLRRARRSAQSKANGRLEPATADDAGRVAIPYSIFRDKSKAYRPATWAT